MLQGTLDLLILKTLALGPSHGQAIATVIEHASDDFLQVEHGSLYPALIGPHWERGSNPNLFLGMGDTHQNYYWVEPIPEAIFQRSCGDQK